MQSHYRANCRPNVKTKRERAEEKEGEEVESQFWQRSLALFLYLGEGVPSFLARGLHFVAQSSSSGVVPAYMSAFLTLKIRIC